MIHPIHSYSQRPKATAGIEPAQVTGMLEGTDLEDDYIFMERASASIFTSPGLYEDENQQL